LERGSLYIEGISGELLSRKVSEDTVWAAYYSAIQEISRILCNPKVNYCVNNSPPPVSIFEPDQYNPCLLTISWMPILISPSQILPCPPSDLFFSGLTSKTLHAHISQYLLHAQPISIYGTGLHKKANFVRRETQKKKHTSEIQTRGQD